MRLSARLSWAQNSDSFGEVSFNVTMLACAVGKFRKSSLARPRLNSLHAICLRKL